MIGSADTQVLDLSLVRPTAAEPELRLRIQSSLNKYPELGLVRPDLLQMTANVSFTPLGAPPVCLVPAGLVHADLQFDFSLADPGALPFPTLLQLDRLSPLPYFRKQRALYLCVAGRWVRAANHSCTPFASLTRLLPTDSVPDPLAFLHSFACHNTEFSVLQQPADAGCSAFVRACNDCVPRRAGCDCEATGACSGFACAWGGAAGGVAALLSALVWLERWWGRQAYEELTDGCSYATLGAVAGGSAAAALAVLGGLYAHLGPGDAHLPNLSAGGLAWTLTALLAARAAAHGAFLASKARALLALGTALEVAAHLLRAAPSATVVDWAAGTAGAHATFALVWVTCAAVAVERLSAEFMARWELPVGAAALGFRFVLWWRMPCE